MPKYAEADWKRLGAWVEQARAEAGYADMKKWSEAVERSSRQLQDLERGRQVGPGTLEVVEQALGWPAGTTYRMLGGSVTLETVHGESAAFTELREELQELREVVARLTGETG